MKKRGLLFMILMTIITLGIYQLYWYIKFQMELKEKPKRFWWFNAFLSFDINAWYLFNCVAI